VSGESGGEGEIAPEIPLATHMRSVKRFRVRGRTFCRSAEARWRFIADEESVYWWRGGGLRKEPGGMNDMPRALDDGLDEWQQVCFDSLQQLF